MSVLKSRRGRRLGTGLPHSLAALFSIAHADTNFAAVFGGWMNPVQSSIGVQPLWRARIARRWDPIDNFLFAFLATFMVDPTRPRTPARAIAPISNRDGGVT